MLAIKDIHTLAHSIATVGSDQQLIDLWLHGKAANTQEAYRRDIDYFIAFLDGKNFQTVTLNDLQAYDVVLREKGYADGTVKRRLNAVKSLLKYGHDLGALAVNASKPLKVRKGNDRLSERILTESQVQKMIHGFKGSERDRLILKFLYATGCRVSELVGLTWESCQSLDDGKGELTIHGKGDKTRTILIGSELWGEVLRLRGDRKLKDAVFPSRTGRPLTRVQVNRIVSDASDQAGIDKAVSPHWFRHAHASHSLKRGAALNLVQKSLGHSRLDTTAVYLHASPDDSSGLYLAL